MASETGFNVDAKKHMIEWHRRAQSCCKHKRAFRCKPWSEAYDLADIRVRK